jgi:hypothetical protein
MEFRRACVIGARGVLLVSSLVLPKLRAVVPK